MKIEDEKQLLEKLKKDIDSTNKERIVFLAGHFPLLYTSEGIIEAFDYWGEFSAYTLELACKLAKDTDKEVGFLLFVDDHAYENWEELSKSQIKGERKRLYKKRSGKDAKLPQQIRKVMKKYGFDEKDIVKHDHGKENRKDCLYISEKVLRADPRAQKVDNYCAREYVAYLEDKKYFDKEKDYLVAFIPQRCKDHICNVALDIEVKELQSSHIFIETSPGVSRKKLYSFGRGITYRKD
jgi:hypothetical protein